MFVQIIEGTTSNADALFAAGDAWQQEVRPKAIGYLGVTAGVATGGKVFTLVRFEDEASARANSELPEQSAWFEKHLATAYDAPPTFTESSDTTEFMGGGSNDAGFVQVMKSTGADRAQLARLDAALEPYSSTRPDLLGGLRIWTGDDTCIEVAYFTSEAEAREGEKAEPPAELQDLMAGVQQGMGDVEYFDLTEPHLR